MISSDFLGFRESFYIAFVANENAALIYSKTQKDLDNPFTSHLLQMKK